MQRLYEANANQVVTTIIQLLQCVRQHHSLRFITGTKFPQNSTKRNNLYVNKTSLDTDNWIWDYIIYRLVVFCHSMSLHLVTITTNKCLPKSWTSLHRSAGISDFVKPLCERIVGLYVK